MMNFGEHKRKNEQRRQCDRAVDGQPGFVRHSVTIEELVAPVTELTAHAARLSLYNNTRKPHNAIIAL